MHAYLETRQYLVDEFIRVSGWSQNANGSWNPPSDATQYGISRADKLNAPEEDFAERMAVSIAIINGYHDVYHLTSSWYWVMNNVPTGPVE